MNRWKLITGVLFVFIAGVLIGVLGTKYYVQQRYFGIKHRPQERTAFITERLTERLHLSESQQAQVYDLIKDMHQAADKIFREHKTEIDNYMDGRMSEVRDLLDTDQQEEFDAMMKEIKKRRKEWRDFPPPRGPGRGPGPPPGGPRPPGGPDNGGDGFSRDGPPGPPPPSF